MSRPVGRSRKVDLVNVCKPAPPKGYDPFGLHFLPVRCPRKGCAGTLSAEVADEKAHVICTDPGCTWVALFVRRGHGAPRLAPIIKVQAPEALAALPRYPRNGDKKLGNCRVDGCHRLVYGVGMCSMHYQRFKAWRRPRTPGLDDSLELFLAAGAPRGQRGSGRLRTGQLRRVGAST